MELGLKNATNPLTCDIVKYIYDKYNTDPEFLWERSPQNAAFKNKRTGKWFAALLMSLSKEHLGLPFSEKVDIINLKCDPLFISLTVDGKGYFRGYHMNKENWISVLLDGTVPYEEICEIIDMSYELIDEKQGGRSSGFQKCTY